MSHPLSNMHYYQTIAYRYSIFEGAVGTHADKRRIKAMKWPPFRSMKYSVGKQVKTVRQVANVAKIPVNFSPSKNLSK